jgi:hypothetical protein
MSERFVRIVDDGTGPVALFERVAAGAKATFALRRDLLRARLAQRQLKGLGTREEERALAALDRALEKAAREHHG